MACADAMAWRRAHGGAGVVPCAAPSHARPHRSRRSHGLRRCYAPRRSHGLRRSITARRAPARVLARVSVLPTPELRPRCSAGGLPKDAGTHSGDATLLLPAQRLNMETHRRVMHIASQLSKALEISGPFNVQFLAQEGSASSHRTVKVIECNVRASRTVPFVSKTLNVNFIELATRVMLGQDLGLCADPSLRV